ncbi:hypothetical protein MHBO_004305, partial [Bonamia ostreae]
CKHYIINYGIYKSKFILDYIHENINTFVNMENELLTFVFGFESDIILLIRLKKTIISKSPIFVQTVNGCRLIRIITNSASKDDLKKIFESILDYKPTSNVLVDLLLNSDFEERKVIIKHFNKNPSFFKRKFYKMLPKSIQEMVQKIC